MNHCCALALGRSAVAGRGLPTVFSGQLCTFQVLVRLRRTQRGRQTNSLVKSDFTGGMTLPAVALYDAF